MALAFIALAYALPSVQLPSGEQRSIDHIAPGRPAAIVVAKGTWCATCMGQLQRLSTKTATSQLLAMDAVVIGLTTDTPAANLAAMQQFGLGMAIVSDREGKLRQTPAELRPRIGNTHDLVKKLAVQKALPETKT